MRRPSLVRLLLPFLALITIAPRAAWADDADALALKERAKQFWQARVDEDYAAVWDLLPPAEQAVVERESFAKFQKERGPIRYYSAEVLEVTALKEVGWVLTRYSVGPKQYKVPPREMHAWDVWEKYEDGWRPCPRTRLENWPHKPPQERPAEEEAALGSRVTAFWNARKAQDWRAAWEFLQPTYRSATTVEEFLSRKSQLDYLGMELAWTEVEGTTGRAKVVFQYKFNDPSLSKMEPKTGADVEEWTKVDGQWYRKLVKTDDPQNPVAPDPSAPTAPPGKPGEPGN